jgi:hypothetical protein
MVVTYALTLEDHLAWFDYHIECVAPLWRLSFPLFGAALVRRRRRSFARSISAAANAPAIGDRSLELSDSGIREYSATFDFSTRWRDLAFAALTPQHIFLVHPSMNAHIVPLRAFSSDEAAGDSFVSFVTSHAPSLCDHRHA